MEVERPSGDEVVLQTGTIPACTVVHYQRGYGLGPLSAAHSRCDSKRNRPTGAAGKAQGDQSR